MSIAAERVSLASVHTAIEESLRTEKRRIVDEIRSYPLPTPACDAQFNYLLERRDVVNQELSQLHSLIGHGDTTGPALRRFVASLLSLNKAAKEQLLTLLGG